MTDEERFALKFLLDSVGTDYPNCEASLRPLCAVPTTGSAPVATNWPVPLSVNQGHVLEHSVELRFESEEDSDDFFRMYGERMGEQASAANAQAPIDFEALELALIVECERAMKQRDQWKETGLSTAGHGGGWDTCFGYILRKFGVAPTSPAASVLTDRQIIDAFKPYREFPVNWIADFGRDVIALLAASKNGGLSDDSQD